MIEFANYAGYLETQSFNGCDTEFEGNDGPGGEAGNQSESPGDIKQGLARCDLLTAQSALANASLEQRIKAALDWHDLSGNAGAVDGDV